MISLRHELRRFVRDIAPIAAVALAVFWTLRGQVLGCYRVVSSSMEPTLHGDPRRGDLVLVDQTAYWRRPPRPQERFDLLVLRPGIAGRDAIVKRAVAFEREYVDIRHGDLFVGRTAQEARSPESLWRKDPLRHEDMLVTHFRFPDAAADRTPRSYFEASRAWRVEGRTIILEPAGRAAKDLLETLSPDAQRRRRGARPPLRSLPGHLSTRVPVDRSFLDAAGRVRGGGGGVADFGVELELNLGAGWRALQLVLEYHDDYFAISWTPGGRARFSFMGAPVGAAGELGAPRGERVFVAFGHLDGRFFFRHGDHVWFPEWNRPLARGPHVRPRFPGPGLENAVHVGVAGAAARILRTRVFHDIYYEALTAPFAEAPAPYHVGPGEVFLLGDNPRESRDSRHRGGGFPAAGVMGRAIAILAPRGRMRWLAR